MKALVALLCILCGSAGRTGSTDSDDGSYDVSSSGRIVTAMPVVLDPMGYYELLGLKPDIEVRAAALQQCWLGSEEIKLSLQHKRGAAAPSGDYQKRRRRLHHVLRLH